MVSKLNHSISKFYSKFRWLSTQLSNKNSFYSMIDSKNDIWDSLYRLSQMSLTANECKPKNSWYFLNFKLNLILFRRFIY